MTLILALETATKACSAALCAADGAAIAEAVSPDGPAHAQRLLPGVHDVLTAGGANWADIGVIAVSLGPGAFTGLRIGVATARALAQADGDARLVGVPTLAALAFWMAANAGGKEPAAGRLLVPIVDARRREVFAAVYRAGEDATISLVRDPVAVTADDLADWLAPLGSALVGGDGAVLYADRLPASASLAADATAPSAAMIGRAAALGVPGLVCGPDGVLPLYGRSPDAARWVRPAGAEEATGR